MAAALSLAMKNILLLDDVREVSRVLVGSLAAAREFFDRTRRQRRVCLSNPFKPRC